MQIIPRLLAVAVIGLGAGGASAGEDGLYLGAAGGLNIARDSQVQGAGIDSKAEFENGLAGVGVIGYGLGTGLRIEFELGYRESDVDSVDGLAGSGDVNALSAMGNVLYDFDLGGPITPFLGVGVGAAQVDFGGVAPVGGGSIGDDDTVFAYQGIAGVAYDISDQFKLTLDYRYFAAPNVDVTTNTGVNIDTDYRSQSIMVGLRFSFGAPPPAPAPAPVAEAAPAPPPPPPAPKVEAPPPPPQLPRNFLVFFDWDRSNLSPEALEIVAAAARNATETGSARIEAAGHADRSGPSQYNVALSQRRADSVKAELVRLGIDAIEIFTFARGETDPLVATPDGVREPQNRRVEIVLK